MIFIHKDQCSNQNGLVSGLSGETSLSLHPTREGINRLKIPSLALQANDFLWSGPREIVDAGVTCTTERPTQWPWDEAQ